jgi:leader peptidase (prepilin peptidase) / N-methyltransferase
MSGELRLLLLAWAGLLGLLVGSFLNVCIFRLPRNCMSVVRPRSRCPKCRALIAWYDNIPVLSWVLLGGKCRGCRAPISPRYAAVELLTGALYFAAAWKLLAGTAPLGPRDVGIFLVQAWFLACLIACSFIDLDFQILPDEITISGTILGLLVAAFLPFLPFLQGDVADLLRFFQIGAQRLRLEGAVEALGSGVRWLQRQKAAGSPWLSLGTSLLGAATGYGVIYGIAALGKRLFRKRIEQLGQTEAMGFGDVKYMAMIGAVLGWRGVLFTLILACLVGSVVGIVKRVATGTMGYVPFGPFLSVGALVMLLWSDWVDRARFAYVAMLRGLAE